MNSSVTISEVSKEIALEFLLRNADSKVNNSETAIKSIGAYLDSELIGVVQFSYPRFLEDQEKYTLEIINASFRKNSNKEELFKKIIEFYKKKFHPCDLFFRRDTLNIENNRAEELKFSLNNSTNIYYWFDPGTTFYTYKITSPESEKYYFGVRKINIPNATIDDCLRDNYLGSGGADSTNKFNNWKKKYKDSLKKEVITIHKTKAEAYHQEKLLIGNFYKTDRNCLNSVPGGALSRTFFYNSVEYKFCLIHGNTKHQGDSCCKCSSSKSFKEKFCPIHGLTNFIGDESCWKCKNQAMFTFKECKIHGFTKHQGDMCSSCHMKSNYVKRWCEKCQRKTSFKGENCHRCSLMKNFSEKECPIHGLKQHKKDKCMACITDTQKETLFCGVCNRETEFFRKKCRTCRTTKA